MRAKDKQKILKTVDKLVEYNETLKNSTAQASICLIKFCVNVINWLMRLTYPIVRLNNVKHWENTKID